MGPAPRRLLPVRRKLVEDDRAELAIEFDALGYRHDRLRSQDEPDLSVFTADEVATIDGVANELCSLTGSQVSELAHDEPGWRLVSEGETIPYGTAYLAHEDVDVPEHLRGTVERRAAELAVEHGHRATRSTPVRLVVIPASGLFPVIVFCGMEVASGSGGEPRIELLDFTVDDGYWDLIDDDPDS